MLYVQVDTTLFDHPKTRKLARLLGVGRVTAVGHLVALWSWAARYAIDGDLSNYRGDPEVIAEGAAWDGNAELFVNALILAGVGTGAGFVDDVDGRLLLHDWDDYYGKLLDRRRADAARKRAQRSQTSSDDAKPVRDTSAGHPQDASRKSGVNVAYRRTTQRSVAQRRQAQQPPAGAAGNGSGGGGLEDACAVYESNIGPLNDIIRADLTAYVATYGAEQVLDAIKVAVKADKPELRYVEGVLKNWQGRGRKNGAPARDPLAAYKIEDIPEGLRSAVKS
jgi:DnaD/phage-associated family protein